MDKQDERQKCGIYTAGEDAKAELEKGDIKC